LPNLVLTTAIFFGLAASWKKMLPVYVGSVLMLIGYFTAAQLSTNLSVNTTAALADPFGATAVDRLTQYWSPFQRNNQLIPLSGILLLNRVLWLGLGAIVLVITYSRFSLAYPSRRAGKARLATDTEIPAPADSRSARRTFSLLIQRFLATVLFLDQNSFHGDGQERLLSGFASGRRLIRHSFRQSNYQSLRKPYLSRHLSDA
jgi:hypothetical protein